MALRYSTPLSVVGRKLSGSCAGSSDPSLDLLAHIALAYDALQRLKMAGVDVEFSGRELVGGPLERAYREALHIRRTVPEGMLDEGTLSKLGKIK